MTEPTTVPEAVTIERSIDCDAPPEEVWPVLTEPDELAEWLGADVEVEVIPGGAGRAVDPDGTVRHILVTDVEPGRRLAWHWWEEGGELSSVEITTSPLDPGTRVRVIETTMLDRVPGRPMACSSTGHHRWVAALGRLHTRTAGARVPAFATRG